MPEKTLTFPGAPSEFDPYFSWSPVCFVYPLPFPRLQILPASMGSTEIDWGGENAFHSESVAYAKCNYGVRVRPDLQLQKGHLPLIRVVDGKGVDAARKTFDSDENPARAVDVARKLVECKVELLPNLYCEALTSDSETIPKNWGHQAMVKEFVYQRRKAQEHAANFSPNEIIARNDDKREDFPVSILPQIVMDEGMDEEITAESSSCFERHSSRKRKRKKSGSATTQDDDLYTKIASLVKQQIEDALSTTLLPLISVLRSREEDEQKHREQMLALEERKLALNREKLLFERRRGAKHPRQSRSSNGPLQIPKTENTALH